MADQRNLVPKDPSFLSLAQHSTSLLHILGWGEKRGEDLRWAGEIELGSSGSKLLFFWPTARVPFHADREALLLHPLNDRHWENWVCGHSVKESCVCLA